MKEHTIVVGLDFGTTYSGVAWAMGGSLEDLEIVSSWPGSTNRTSEKVPTVMTYDTLNGKSRFRWGFQSPPFGDQITCLKLLLDEDQLRHTLCNDSKDILRILDKDPVDVASDYLRELFKVVKDLQVRRLGAQYVNSASFRIILTVPAIWSEKAQDSTLRAAEKAGLTDHDVRMISEPEAAALHTLRSIQPNTITKGDTFVVCDAGGGTVDLITYRVKCVEPLDLEEVVRGDGGICGSTTLDTRFMKFMEKRLGSQFLQISAKGRQVMLSSWINDIKCSFSGAEEMGGEVDEYLVAVPNVSDNPIKGIESGLMLIESTEVANIFDPIIHEIENLISDQMRRVKVSGDNVKAILLVGGFGSSIYLFKKLQLRFQTVDIMQPPNAWTSVVRGAVFNGADDTTVSLRKARRHYGVQASELFDELFHPASCKEWDNIENIWRAANRMTWFIKKGGPLEHGKRISFNFRRHTTVENPIFIYNDELLACDGENRPQDSMHPSIFTLCTLTADLSKIPKELFDKITSSGGTEYYRVNYELVMIPTSASLLFEMVFKGLPYGAIRAQY